MLADYNLERENFEKVGSAWTGLVFEIFSRTSIPKPASSTPPLASHLY
jgi:hypothetical protein